MGADCFGWPNSSLSAGGVKGIGHNTRPRVPIRSVLAMGVPRLITTLQPFSERRKLEGRKVVIDGPGFAYHIIHLCEQAVRPVLPLNQPSPALLGQTALAWLDRLESHGVAV